MQIIKDAANWEEFIKDVPSDVKAALDWCFPGEDWKLYASHSFIDLENTSTGARPFCTGIGTGYNNALRQLIIWVREGMPERGND